MSALTFLGDQLEVVSGFNYFGSLITSGFGVREIESSFREPPTLVALP